MKVALHCFAVDTFELCGRQKPFSLAVSSYKTGLFDATFDVARTVERKRVWMWRGG